MEAGKLRHRVTIQSPTETTSTVSREKLVTYADAETVWAQVRPLTARELLQASRPVTVQTYVVSMRFWSGLTSRHRLTWEGKTLAITGVTDVDGRGIEHQVLASETR